MSESSRWRIVGINFSHMHMGDLLHQVDQHPNADIVGICDEKPDEMADAIASLNLDESKVFTDFQACLESTQPDIAILCPPTGEHADWVERVAPFGVHLFVEKPFAASLADADRMIAAADASGKRLLINWPIRWEPCYYTTSRLIEAGLIGDVIEVHHYGGNRGPLFHRADKVEHEPTEEEKQNSWWYKLESGGGSLRDYLGYGVTLGTWFRNGKKPIDVTCVTTASPGLEVDEHSVTVARYDNGLSKFETRWGTFTDPWIHQPQPKCGFIVVGTDGTISAYDYEQTIRIQTREHPGGYDHPVELLPENEKNGIAYMIHRLESDQPIDGPLSPETSRIGQQIIESAILSAEQGATVPLAE